MAQSPFPIRPQAWYINRGEAPAVVSIPATPRSVPDVWRAGPGELVEGPANYWDSFAPCGLALATSKEIADWKAKLEGGSNDEKSEPVPGEVPAAEPSVTDETPAPKASKSIFGGGKKAK